MSDAASPASAAAATIHVVVNGEPVETSAPTLAALLVERGYGEARIATALNGEFVALRNRGSTSLRAGDKIEIVSPRQGG